jgi:hypothetical protein
MVENIYDRDGNGARGVWIALLLVFIFWTGVYFLFF